MDHQFHFSLPGSRPLLNGTVVEAPARFYQRRTRSGDVTGLWIGGQRMYGVAIFDAAGRPVGSIHPAGPQAAEAYDDLQRVLVSEALQT